MPGTPESAGGAPEQNPFLMSPEQTEAAMAERTDAEAKRADAINQALETGQPMVVERDTEVVDPNSLTDTAKINAMRRSGLTDEQISEHLANPDGEEDK